MNTEEKVAVTATLTVDYNTPTRADQVRSMFLKSFALEFHHLRNGSFFLSHFLIYSTGLNSSLLKFDSS